MLLALRSRVRTRAGLGVRNLHTDVLYFAIGIVKVSRP
jgi:hypothetical protein